MPPRVGSRSTAICGAAVSIAFVSPLSGAQSLWISGGSSSPWRAAMTAAEWSPMNPLRITSMPAQTWRGEISTPAMISPIPAVLMKIPSAPPLPTTFVSPVTI